MSHPPEPPPSGSARGARATQDPGAASAARIPGRVWGGAALQAAGRLWGSACTAAILLLLARRLPGAEFGRLTFYLALLGLLACWNDLGTGTAVVQRTAHDPPGLPGALRAGRRLRLATTASGFLAIALLALVLGEPGAGWIVLAALFPLTRVAELSSVLWQNELDWRVPVGARAAGATARLAGTLALAAAGVERAAPYLVVHTAGLALGNLLVHALARPRLAALTRLAAGRAVAARELFRRAWPLGLAAVFQQAYVSLDNLFVREWRGEVELGRYNAAVRLSSLLLMTGTYATSTALPWLARRWRAGGLGRATARLGQPLLAVAGLVLGALVPWSEQLLGTLFGEPFASAGPSLRWLLGAAAVVHGGAVLLTALLATGAARTVLAVAASALVVNALGNALLVPALGSLGAARATFATELWIALASWAALARRGAAPARPLGWLGGPALFALGWWLSAFLT